ncbi:hypothetical protein FOZ63_013771, partial [Perkinsus olseni]
MLAGLARPTIFRPTLERLASGVPSSVLSGSCLSPYPTLTMVRFHNTQAFVAPLNGPKSQEDAEAEKACTKVTWVGLASNVGLSAFKLGAGISCWGIVHGYAGSLSSLALQSPPHDLRLSNRSSFEQDGLLCHSTTLRHPLMIPSSVLSLASHKEKDSITLDQLEYRLAKPSDVLLGEMVEPDAGVFVAAEKGKG